METTLERVRQLEEAIDDMKKGNININLNMFENQSDYEMVSDKVMKLVKGEINYLECEIKSQLYAKLRRDDDELYSSQKSRGNNSRK